MSAFLSQVCNLASSEAFAVGNSRSPSPKLLFLAEILNVCGRALDPSVLNFPSQMPDLTVYASIMLVFGPLYSEECSQATKLLNPLRTRLLEFSFWLSRWLNRCQKGEVNETTLTEVRVHYDTLLSSYMDLKKCSTGMPAMMSTAMLDGWIYEAQEISREIVDVLYPHCLACSESQR